MQKMKYILPAPEEVGHHLPTAVEVAPPPQTVLTSPAVLEAEHVIVPAAVEPAGTIIQQYAAAPAAGYQAPVATYQASASYQAPSATYHSSPTASVQPQYHVQPNPGSYTPAISYAGLFQHSLEG